ncbi:Hsp33 family molecular chaperone HslO [Syntrophomonas erecta]
MNRNYLIKAMDKDSQVRVTIASTTGVVEEAHRRHQTSATASAALGRVLTAAIMMGSDLKGKQDILTLRVDGGGPAGTIIAATDSQGNARGLITNPQADVPSRYPGKLAVGELVGNNGYLEVIKDLGLKQPFVGRVNLISGEIAEDMAVYFQQSEQIPSLVSLGVLVAPDLHIQVAGGLIVQAMPGANDKILQVIEDNVFKMGPISDVMNHSGSLEEVLEQVMKGIEYHQVGKRQLAFRCNCNHDKLGRIMAGLDWEELEDIYNQMGKLEVCCNFCNEVYNYSLSEIEAYKSEKP